jgi:L-ascorbate metabolism protein UlaG (beta-lactamase superfamily)
MPRVSRVLRPAAIAAAVGAIAALMWIVRSSSATSRFEASKNAAPGNVDPTSWSNRKITISNLGHATLLMNFAGVRIISDPALFNHVGLAIGPLGTIGPRRMVPPPLQPDQLQGLDLILITHAHMDHLDIPSLEALPKSATVIACAGCSDLIRPLGFADVRELHWGGSTVVKGLTITAMGARHWGKRWPPFGREYGFNSYVLDKDGHRMLLACDSAMTDLFASLRTNPPEIAAFSIGAYDPWISNHANPEQVWEMFTATGARYLIPIHWGTFRLSKEPRDEPMRRLIAAAGADSDRIVDRRIGTAWTLSDHVAAGTL